MALEAAWRGPRTRGVGEGVSSPQRSCWSLLLRHEAEGGGGRHFGPGHAVGEAAAVLVGVFGHHAAGFPAHEGFMKSGRRGCRVQPFYGLSKGLCQLSRLHGCLAPAGGPRRRPLRRLRLRAFGVFDVGCKTLTLLTGSHCWMGGG